MHNYKHKKVFVFGLGKTGASIIRFLETLDSTIYAWDDNDKNISNIRQSFSKIELVSYKTFQSWNEITTIFLSPGIPTLTGKEHEIVKIAKEHSIPISSDFDLLYQSNTKSKNIGITGTNGKSTTTSLIGHILKNGGISTHVGGNIGIPALNLTPYRQCNVLEISSFQLNLMQEMRFDIAVLLNITQDHISYHGSMEAYIEAKRKIFQKQSPENTAIINYDQTILREIGYQLNNILFISTKEILKDGLTVIDNKIYHKGCEYNITRPPCLKGEHNTQNIAAAFAACITYGLNPETIAQGIKTFAGLQHRMELIHHHKNIQCINDSKATNIDAAEKSLLTFNNIYWIVGGRSKGNSITELQHTFHNITKAYLIGETQEEFALSLKNTPLQFMKCDNMKKAMEHISNDLKHAIPHREATVLLAPACASFDQYNNFEERGKHFSNMAKLYFTRI